jgi:drug/metabolite transporter (DMT)-like permease
MPTLAVSPYLLAIASNLFFGTATLTFSRFSKSHSAAWVNQLKVSVALIGFIAAFFAFEHFTPMPLTGNLAIIGSGILGLFLGDYFLFRAFASLGPSRTLVLYSFQPFLLGIYGSIFLNQHLSGVQFIAILCMVACVFTFVWERSRVTGSLELKNFGFAFLGIFFDAVGVMLSRAAYESSPALGPFQANAMRAAGAFFGFLVISPLFLGSLTRELGIMSKRDRTKVLTACFFGTFLSLAFYLSALKTAHLATLTAISITSPIWASLFEHLQLKRWPSRYLWCAFGLFILGFYLMQK